MYQTTFKDNKYTIFYDYSENNTRNIDMSYGAIHITPLENDEYTKFFQDVDAAVNIGPFILSIFMDASGITYAKDTNGNDINLRLVKSNSYTYPYMDYTGGYVDGQFIFIFDDGSTFTNIDLNNSEYWYYIQGVSDMNNLLQWT
jgi:hypothetical protein